MTLLAQFYAQTNLISKLGVGKGNCFRKPAHMVIKNAKKAPKVKNYLKGSILDSWGHVLRSVPPGGY